VYKILWNTMSAEVIKQGTKSFWKTKTTIEVLLLEHPNSDVLEIVCFDPITNQEAPHIFILRSKVVLLICDEEIQYRLFELQEPIRQRHGIIDNDALLKIAWNDAIYDLVDDRLELHKLLAGSKAFRVSLRKPLPDEDPRSADLMCCAPSSIVPFELDHFTAPRRTILEEAKEDAVEVTATRKKVVATLPSILNVPTTLTARQRWRIPIIFTKVFNGNRLKMADRVIWKVVALNLLSDADPHERMAIANFESPTLCIDFAARRKVVILLHKSDPEPEQARGLARPAPIHIGELDAFGHTKLSPKLTTAPHNTPASHRFADPAPMHTGSFKFGISALSSSLQRGLNSFSHSLDTKNKHFRAAAGADLAAESPTTNTPKHRRDTHHPSPSANSNHSRAGATPRGRGRGANGRSPHHRNHATPRAPANTPQHLPHGDDTDLLSQPSDKQLRGKEKGSNNEWFAVSLSRKLAGMVSGAISGKHRHRIHASHSHDEGEEDDDEDFASLGHASSTGPAANSVAGFDQDDQSHHSHHSFQSHHSHHSLHSLHSDMFKQSQAKEKERDGTRTPPPLSSRPQSREIEGASAVTAAASDAHTASSSGQQNESQSLCTHHESATSNSHNTKHSHSPTHKQTNKHPRKQDNKKQDAKPKKASSPISGAIGALISNLSGKSRTYKSTSPKTAHSLTHQEHDTRDPSTGQAPNVVSGTPAEGGPVQKFYQLITLRGRNVVIRPAVNISHDTVVLYH